MLLSDVDAAYIAGLVDGEGCIRIDRFKTDRSHIGFQYRTTVTIAMCDPETIRWVGTTTDRKISEYQIPSGRTVYTVVWRNGPAKELLLAILPFLRGKRPQAELCIHFEENITPGRGRTYKTGDKERCDEIRDRVSALKKPPKPFAADRPQL